MYYSTKTWNQKSCNFLRNALGLHTNSFTYFAFQKVSCRTWHVTMELLYKVLIFSHTYLVSLSLSHTHARTNGIHILYNIQLTKFKTAVNTKKSKIMTHNCHDPKLLLPSESGKFSELRVQPRNLIGMECSWRNVYACWTCIFNNAERIKHFSVLSLLLISTQNFWVMQVYLWLSNVFVDTFSSFWSWSCTRKYTLGAETETKPWEVPMDNMKTFSLTYRHGAPIPDTELSSFLLLYKEARR